MPSSVIAMSLLLSSVQRVAPDKSALDSRSRSVNMSVVSRMPSEAVLAVLAVEELDEDDWDDCELALLEPAPAFEDEAVDEAVADDELDEASELEFELALVAKPAFEQPASAKAAARLNVQAMVAKRFIENIPPFRLVDLQGESVGSNA